MGKLSTPKGVKVFLFSQKEGMKTDSTGFLTDFVINDSVAYDFGFLGERRP